MLHPTVRLVAVAILLLQLSGGCAPVATPPAPPSVPLAPQAEKRWTYKLVPASQWQSPEREEEMDATIPAFDPRLETSSAAQITATFRGQDRRRAKTSIATASTEAFSSLGALIATLPDDDAMRDRQPRIRKTSNRVGEERRNVRLPLWIYAIKYETDQDWHVIAGTNPAQTGRTYFNCEISGLPGSSAASYDTLLGVRQQLDDILDHDLPGQSSYHEYEDPIPVTIEGSLFFDIDHASGAVGPAGMRPDSSWEIHPITDLDPRP